MAVINLSALVGKDVFTRNAKYVGKIDDTMVDTEKGNIYGFAVAMSKDSFLYRMLSRSEQGVKKTILIPYREILAADDIVLVTVPRQYERAEGDETAAAREAAPAEEALLQLPGATETE